MTETTQQSTSTRIWLLALLLILAGTLAGCATEDEGAGEEEALGEEQEAAGEEETPGIGFAAAVGAIGLTAVAIRRLRN